MIEVDGGYHLKAVQKIKDAEKQRLLENLGFHFLRFEDEAVKKDMPLALRKIKDYIAGFEKDYPQEKKDRKIDGGCA